MVYYSWMTKRTYLPRRSSTSFSFFLAAREKKRKWKSDRLKKYACAEKRFWYHFVYYTKNFQFKNLEVIYRRFQKIWKVTERKHLIFNLLIFIETFLLVKSNSLKFGYWRTNTLSNWLAGWMADWLTAADWFIHWKSTSKNSKRLVL